MELDVAIIGGGPAGSTTGTLIKKYNPAISVGIFEKEVFPRDHIGESMLPGISSVLHEMGVWDTVEAANFPIKIGSTNRWGKKPELWDFEFFPSNLFVDEPRPAKYEGQRRGTAFQVDRSIYDKILLDHAESRGAVVRQGTRAAKVHRQGDRVTAIELATGEMVQAKHYVDASGHVGVIRRAMGVNMDCPTTLQNVAFWDYWQNAEWAVKIGIGGTKIQVMSLGYGWLWFIPLGPTRTSIGLVVPASYYKNSGRRPEDLYLEAVATEERIAALTKNATREHKFTTTKDWSFLSERQCGDNWFLAGESAGFADPILSAGMTMAHAAGRELAYTLLEIERGNKRVQWLKDEFAIRQSQRVRTHMRFAEFWYSANAQFSDLQDFTKQLAHDVGLDLTPESAWRWIAQGGFVDERLSFGVGGFTLNSIKTLGSVLSDVEATSPFQSNNVFKLNLAGASWRDRAQYRDGRVFPTQSYTRDGRTLPIDGACQIVVDLLQRTSDVVSLFEMLRRSIQNDFEDMGQQNRAMVEVVQALEAMTNDGWVDASFNPQRPLMNVSYLDQSILPNQDPPIQ
ncbi:MAG: NAD(P)/FAD-dependent oxidoreductase [Fimbriimonas sp.]|nr:NAD(P)/FAD-dependent oxidoreductase [Fimbriimonas sp.]